MIDIFDKLKEEKPDIFDELSKKVELKVILPDSKDDIFDRLKAELPALLKKYIKPDRKEVELSGEIIDLIKKEIAQIKLPEKVVEKVIEKRVIEKPKEIRIENPIDVKALKEEFDKKISEAIAKARKEWKESDEGTRIVVTSFPLPNMAHHVGDYLSVENSVNGLQAKWGPISTVPIGNQDTDGSWRIVVSSNDLAFERREAGSWIQKGLMQA